MSGAPGQSNGDHEVHAIGIDVGGTKIAAGLASFPDGRVLARRLAPTEAIRGGRAALETAVRLAAELAGEASAQALRVAGIGVGVCELVDRDGKIVSSNCVDWEDERVVEAFRAAVAGAVVVEADVRAAALAESLLGAGQPFRQFLFVTIGTGISCCLMIDGRPHLGARGLTGTMGSSPIRIPCEQCGHVSHRTLEELASGPAVVSRFNALHGNAASGHDVIRAAAGGHPVAAPIVRQAAESLGSQLGLLINVLDPEAVVIGGGLGASEGPYWDHVIESTRRHVWSPLVAGLPIVRAATGADAGWLGAAARAWRESEPAAAIHDTRPRSG